MDARTLGRLARSRARAIFRPLGNRPAFTQAVDRGESIIWVEVRRGGALERWALPDTLANREALHAFTQALRDRFADLEAVVIRIGPVQQERDAWVWAQAGEGVL